MALAPPGYGGGGGAQYDFDRDMYGDELTILNIDAIHPRIKMKTKRDVQNFLKKGRFKFRYKVYRATIMGKKYLDTKKNSLEDAVLEVFIKESVLAGRDYKYDGKGPIKNI